VIAFEEKLIENAYRIISQFDIVVDGSDNFTTRYLVNDTWLWAKQWSMAFWVLKDSLLFLITRKQNLRDLFPEPPSSKDVPNCSFNGFRNITRNDGHDDGT
jgi:adenylyltransferase/sulfurtransferase